ncbi:MFS transporter [Glutamicibacter halophytocola]|uniref:MFS transporter n=1 Tax=Glutamicibacter halophytocola TaxID=1933880 RepID=UPI001558B696|nr:MFS transporter [Glutamicibacter halophytocola]NQD40495.1 MHS family MFS transporter [Glutamicibacter halophytocola]
MSNVANEAQSNDGAQVSSAEPDEIVIDPKASRRAVMSGTFGTALEWFDFAVYGTLSATVFPALFFPGFDANTAILASFATFGAGMAARPLGGIIFGALGDRIGRRDVLMLTLVLMGLSSIAIGLLPTYATIGFLAPLLLVILRFLQGFALGGESTGAQVLVVEYAPKGKRGLFGGFLATGSPVAQSIASLTLTGLALFLSEESFNSWGWRIPFLMGVLLLVVGVIIRRRLEETPAFKESQRKAAENAIPQERALAVLVKRPLTVIRLVGACAAMAALFWICVTYAVNYLTSVLGYEKSATFGILLIANLISIPAAVFGGWISDKLGRKKTFLLGLLLQGIAASSLFPIMNSMNLVGTTLIIALALCGIQINAGTQASFFAESLPTSMRYTGSALGMTFGGLIFGAPIPFIAAWIFQHSENGTLALTVIALSIVALSMIATLTLPERFKQQLHEVN